MGLLTRYSWWRGADDMAFIVSSLCRDDDVANAAPSVCSDDDMACAPPPPLIFFFIQLIDHIFYVIFFVEIDPQLPLVHENYPIPFGL